MRAAIYLRVSTDGQTTANQEGELQAAAERMGHEIVAVYRDAGISGSKGRDQRPGFDAMHKDAPRRRFDVGGPIARPEYEVAARRLFEQASYKCPTDILIRLRHGSDVL